MMVSAPAAAARAVSLGQPSRGLTRRNSDNPKLAIARAAKPIFSPSCGAMRMTAGAKLGAFGVARDLGFARALGFMRAPASALAFIIGTRCYRGSLSRTYLTIPSRPRQWLVPANYPAGEGIAIAVNHLSSR